MIVKTDEVDESRPATELSRLKACFKFSRKKHMTTPTENKTSPQFARMLRGLMFMDQAVSRRNARFLADKMQILSSDAPEHEKDQSLNHLIQSTFKQELQAVSAHMQLKAQVEQMRQEQTVAAMQSKKMTKRFLDKLGKLEQQVAMPIESFVAQSLFQGVSMRSLKKEFPDIEQQLKREIRTAAKNPAYEHMHPCARHLPATVDVFKKIYPDVIPQLEEQVKNSQSMMSELSGVALGLLKSASPLALQDPKKNSRAFIAVAFTSTFAPMIRRLSVGLGQIVEKTSIKPAVKQLFATDWVKRIQQTAVGVGMSLAMLYAGQSLMTPQDLHDLSASISQPAMSLAHQEAPRIASLSSVHVPGVEFAPDPETTVLFSPSLTDSVDEPDHADGFVLEPVDQEGPSLTPSAAGGEYLTQSGDTLSEIVQEQLEQAGIPYSYDDIQDLYQITAEINNMPNPDVLQAGKVLELVTIPVDEAYGFQDPCPEPTPNINALIFESPTFSVEQTPSESIRPSW